MAYLGVLMEWLKEIKGEKMNLQIDLFKNQIYKIINNSQLPIGVIKQIFHNIVHDIDELYNCQIIQQKQLLIKEQQNKNKQQEKNNKQLNNQNDSFEIKINDKLQKWIPDQEDEEKNKNYQERNG